jgi:tetratricopeptide (TPR) repeat protein
LFASQLEIGNILMARGDTVGALEAYQGSLPLMEQMAKANPGNVVWQLNLSIAYNSIGDVFAAQSKRDEALKWYRESLAVRERLTDIDPSNANWQYALTVSCGRVGDILKTQGKLLEALAAYQKGLAIDRRLLQIDPNNALWQAALSNDGEDIAGVSYKFLLAGKFAKALEASDQAIAAMPDTIWPHSNRAHALMFLGRKDEARALYLKYRGAPNAQGDRNWNDIVRVDFKELREAGHTHPLMAEIETALGQATAAEPSH